MRVSVPKLLVPLEITGAMLTSSTVAEPAAGESAWVSAGTYTNGQMVARSTTHKRYMARSDHTGQTTPPESDPTRWKEIGATAQWAMFDGLQNSRTETVTSMTVVLKPGFFNAVALYGVVGGTLTITVKDAPAGAVVATQTWSVDGPYTDEYDWCFGPPRARNRFLLTGILPYPDAELTVTVTAAVGAAVGIGMLAVGHLRALILGEWGGTQYGAQVTPTSNHYVNTDEFGTTTIKRRGTSQDLRLSVILPQSDADYALSVIQEVSGVPVAVIGTEASGYAGLNVFGLVTGPVTYDGPNHATLEASVTGLY